MAKTDGETARLSSMQKLLVLSLIRQGLKQDHVAATLGIHRTSLSRCFPKGVLAEVARLSGKNQDNFDG